MNRISVRTEDGVVDLAIARLKIFFGDDSDFTFALFRSIEQYFEKCTSTEYVAELIGDAAVYLDDAPMVVRDTMLFRIDPYFDFRTNLKMGAGSLLHRYAEMLLSELPYDDTYATVATAFAILGSESIAETLDMEEGDARISFDIEPVTQKTIVKLLLPRISKNGFEAEQYSFTRSESIRLQLGIIARIAAKADRDVIVLYDGPLGQDGLDPFVRWSESVGRGRVLVATSTHHAPADLSAYTLVGKRTHIDLADWRCFEERIGMDLPWHWDEKDLRSVVSAFIGGSIDEKSLSIAKIFR